MLRPLTLLLVSLIAAIPLWADSFGQGFAGYTITPVFRNNVNSPGLPLIPLSYGGITLNPEDPNQLIIGGTAEGSGAAFYSIQVTRDSLGHIQGLAGNPKLFLAAPKLAAGAVFGPSFNPGEVFFYSIASGSGGVDVGMVRWGSAGPARVVDLVPETPGGLNFQPPGLGDLKILTISGKFYSVAFSPEPNGTYEFKSASLRATLPVAGVQGFVYLRGGIPGFPVDSLLVAEHRSSSIAAYDIDSRGDPLPLTRRTFLAGPPFARPEGLFIDPQTGDLLVTTFSSSTSAIHRISGFGLPPSTPISSCQTISSPGYYHLTGDLKAPPSQDCIRLTGVQNVHLDCRTQSIESETTPLSVDGVRGFSIRNCAIPLGRSGDSLAVERSGDGLLAGNVFGDRCSSSPCASWLYFFRTGHINFVNNRSKVSLLLEDTGGTLIRFNRFATSDHALLAAMGAGTTFDSNTVSTSTAFAAVEVHDESDPIVSNNTIIGTGGGIHLNWVSGGHVNANSIKVSYAALAADFDVNNVTWSNNRAVSNRTGTGPYKGMGFLISGWYRHGPENNKFIRNNVADMENPSRFDLYPPGHNVFTENDFGHAISGPDFSRGAPIAPGIIIDGGGNRCVPPVGPYPLACR